MKSGFCRTDRNPTWEVVSHHVCADGSQSAQLETQQWVLPPNDVTLRDTRAFPSAEGAIGGAGM